MSDHKLPKTYDDAIAQGYKPITDLKQFVAEKLGLTMDQFHARGHDFALDPNSVDCTTAPPGTLCRRQCVTDSHGNRVGILGKCANGGCVLAYGQC